MTALADRQHDRRRRVVLWSGPLLIVALLLVLTRCAYLRGSEGAAAEPATSSAPPSTQIVGGGGGSTVDAGGAATGAGFTMVATLTAAQLRPGESRTLVITVDNPASWPIRVLSIDVTPQRPSAAGCSASWVRVGRYRASDGPALIVAARRTSAISVSIVLVDLPTTNQDACKGARFPLLLAGSARQTS